LGQSYQFDRVLSRVLTFATVVAVVLLGVDRLNRPARPAEKTNRIEQVKGWATSMPLAGVALEDTSTPVKLAEFTDAQCPFCRRMESTLTILGESLSRHNS